MARNKLCSIVRRVVYSLFISVFLLLWGVLTVALPPLWAGIRFLANHAAATSMRYGVVQRVVKVAGPFRDYLPVAAILVIGSVVALMTGDGFLDLAELVHEQSPTLQAFDLRVHDWAVAQRNSGATSFFDVMSNAGGPYGSAVLLVVISAVLLWKRRFRWLAYILLTVVGGGLLDLQLKLYFARARPDVALMLMHASGYSFPSGHAMGATVFWGSVSYLGFRVLREWWQCAAAVAFGLTMILAVALSRVYLGVHWISDVTAGIVCGLLWVTVTTGAYETLRRIRAIRALRMKRQEATAA